LKKHKIVVVEDEPAILRGLLDVLEVGGFEAVGAADGEAGLDEARRVGVDLVLLDLLLPKMDGLQVLAELRKTHASLPVIILTARGSEEDRVRGLRGGADDYVVMPFSAKELLARVEAVLRRSPERPSPVKGILTRWGSVDFDRSEIAFQNGTRAHLSDMESGVLVHLAANRGRAVSRDELLIRVWGIGGNKVETRAIDMHITRLRSKLQAGGGGEQEWIVTVRGKGYMLGPEVSLLTAEKAAAGGV
jgi:DNA-binding response OmpR family regulator